MCFTSTLSTLVRIYIQTLAASAVQDVSPGGQLLSLLSFLLLRTLGTVNPGQLNGQGQGAGIDATEVETHDLTFNPPLQPGPRLPHWAMGKGECFATGQGKEELRVSEEMWVL